MIDFIKMVDKEIKILGNREIYKNHKIIKDFRMNPVIIKGKIILEILINLKMISKT